MKWWAYIRYCLVQGHYYWTSNSANYGVVRGCRKCSLYEKNVDRKLVLQDIRDWKFAGKVRRLHNPNTFVVTKRTKKNAK